MTNGMDKAKLTTDDKDFLERVRDGRRLKLADRAEDRVRRRCSKAGLVRVDMNPRRWTITALGLTALSQLDGGDGAKPS